MLTIRQNQQNRQNRQNWQNWLRASPARDPASGLLLSWVAPDKSGFAYLEATAWALLAQADEPAGTAALRHEITAHGGIGLLGKIYLFDTGVALQAFIERDDDEAVAILQRTVNEMIDAQIAVQGGATLRATTQDARWSQSFGAHLLWLCRPLVALGDRSRASQLIDLILPGCLRGESTIAVHSQTNTRYAHALAYAAEGLVCWDPQHPVAGSVIAELLDVAEHHDGLIPAHVDNGPLRTDVAAQTLALAARTGRTDHPAVAMIQARLQQLTQPCGGLPYEPNSAHINACATAFAAIAATSLANRTFVQ